MPAKQTTSTPVVLVAGDTSIEWNVALLDEARADAHSVAGGVWLLADLIREAVSASPSIAQKPFVLAPEPPAHPASDAALAPAYRHVAFRQILEDSVEGDAVKKRKAWRVQQFLGGGGQAPKERWAKAPGPVEILAIDDANGAFREQPERWGETLKAMKTASWIPYRMSKPVAEGKLWDALAEGRTRTIAVVNVDELRNADILVSRGISWERTCEELAWELQFSPSLAALAQCAAVVVLFPYVGAFLWDNRAGRRDAYGASCRLVFDPGCLEGQWLESRKGAMTGAEATLLAALTREVLADGQHPNLEKAVRTAIAAMRVAFDVGYDATTGPAGETRLSFPTAKVAAVADPGEKVIKDVAIPRPWSRRPGEYAEGWTFLEACVADKLDKVARDVVVRGVKKGLAGVPAVRIGKLVTVDREEIESYNAIRVLVAEYLKADATQPLSIAVFGPPGSGKSFGIKQLAENLSDRIKKIEFNLSQFRDPVELYAAFHQVRDWVLRGKLPLVFWDEFDSALGDQDLFWLKFFLMPMQDGAFLQGELERPLGKCIFVFAGGASRTFAGFAAQPGKAPGWFKGVKGPDFISRIKGHLNVLGPNQRLDENDAPVAADRFFRLRRAILLRSFLEDRNLRVKDAGGVVRIDPAMLDALLDLSAYKHGARSMESIVKMSALQGRTKFERSCLPQGPQLAGHVDPDELLQLVQRQAITPDILENMARALHEEIYRKSAVTELARVPWEDLPEELKESNRAHVRFLESRLRSAGFATVPMRGAPESLVLSAKELETLARQEHERWMEERAGWTLGYPKVVPPKGRISPYLTPWEDLPEKVKDYDRAFIRDLPVYLAPSGYTIRAVARRTVAAAEKVVRTVRIGVIGFQSFAPERESVLRERALAALDSIRAEAARESETARFTVVSPLAGDADRLVAKAALDSLGADLKAVLPFDREARSGQATELLSKARHVVHLPPVLPADRPDREEIVRCQAGEFVADDCDALIVVGDVEGAGDATAIVSYARARRCRVFQLDPGGPAAP